MSAETNTMPDGSGAEQVTLPEMKKENVDADLRPLPAQDKMDLLNNITLEVRVEIGRASLKISDLLEVKEGTIIELDKLSNDPLNIYANDKLIAKGTIISAHGRYCVRIL
jgi:flagellar motor switch protein FliN